MRDIDRVQSMGEPPKRPPDHRLSRRPVKPEERDPAMSESEPPAAEPETERAGTIDLRV
jgi:hypothetical protein